MDTPIHRGVPDHFFGPPPVLQQNIFWMQPLCKKRTNGTQTWPLYDTGWTHHNHSGQLCRIMAEGTNTNHFLRNVEDAKNDSKFRCGTTMSIVSWTTMWRHVLQTGECAQPQQGLSHFHIWTVSLCAELQGLTVGPDTQRHWQNTESRVAQIYKVFPSNLACLAAGTQCRQSFPC